MKVMQKTMPLYNNYILFEMSKTFFKKADP